MSSLTVETYLIIKGRILCPDQHCQKKFLKLIPNLSMWTPTLESPVVLRIYTIYNMITQNPCSRQIPRFYNSIY